MESEEQPPGLRWLIRLRWMAGVGIPLLVFFARWRYDIAFPWGVVWGVFLCVVVGNLAAGGLSKRGVPEARLSTALVLGDILLLTCLLYYTGGAHNPFTVLYLLHITLAVMLLSGAMAWLAVVLCGGSFAFLFSSGHMLVTRAGVPLCTDLNFHLQGMLVATVVAGAGVVYFVTRLNASLLAQGKIIERSRALAEREKRLASVATLAAGLAHELATPLSTIAVVSKELESASSELCHNPACQEDVRQIRKEVERCRAILQRIGNQAVTEEVCQTRPVVADTLPARLEPFLPLHLTGRVKWKFRHPLPALVTQPEPLLRALAVLVKNALDASKDGQRVGIEVSQEAGSSGWRISVRDHGCGMTQETLDHLGEPFFTTKEPGAGMGLGFFLARALIERIEGKIEVESQLNVGTVATIVIPNLQRP